MFKKSLAIFVISSIAVGNSFAIPLLNKIMMRNHSVETSMTKDHTKNSSFSGTWLGTCTGGDVTTETKFKILEDYDEFSFVDLTDERQHGKTFKFNTIETESRADKDWYHSSIYKMTKVNDNTIMINTTGFASSHHSNDSQEPISSAYITTMNVVNNQLTIESKVKVSSNSTEADLVKCALKRVA